MQDAGEYKQQDNNFVTTTSPQGCENIACAFYVCQELDLPKTINYLAKIDGSRNSRRSQSLKAWVDNINTVGASGCKRKARQSRIPRFGLVPFPGSGCGGAPKKVPPPSTHYVPLLCLGSTLCYLPKVRKFKSMQDR